MTTLRDCMSDRIKQSILDRISEGVYAPGARLIELQIAREFQTSQAPVREALCKLESMRIVETEPYKGTRVREISSQELSECLQIRGVLENLAAELVEDRVLNNIALLKKKAQDTVIAAREHNVHDYSAANLDFHRLIVQSSNNLTLAALWESLCPEVRMFASVRANAGNLIEAANDHLEIVEAFAESENRFAGKLLKKHAEAGLISVSKQEFLKDGRRQA